MNNIIPKLFEYENDIKLLKSSIIVLENNFSSIKKDFIAICKKENIKSPKNKESVFKKSSIIISLKVREFFCIDSENKNHILVSELNKYINTYLIEKKLIKNNKIYLNKELKTLLNTKKRLIVLDDILNIIINTN